MNQQEYDKLRKDFIDTCEKVRLEAYIATGYEWIVVPKTGANRTIKAQHGLYIQPTDGIDNDHDGLVDEKDEFVTRADGAQSPHNFDLARDICPCKKSNVPWWPNADNPLWKTMADIAVKNGLVSGFYFKSLFDGPHVESKEWKLVQAAWRKGEIYVA